MRKEINDKKFVKRELDDEKSIQYEDENIEEEQYSDEDYPDGDYPEGEYPEGSGSTTEVYENNVAESENYDENESIDYMGYNENKDYEIEHANFKKYIKKSRKQMARLRIAVIVFLILLLLAFAFIMFIVIDEKSKGKPFFAELIDDGEHYKLTEELESVVREFDDDIFSASVDTVDGYEYLKLSAIMDGEDVSLYMRNEFPANADAKTERCFFRKSNGSKLSVSIDYDILEPEHYLPEIVNLSDGGHGFLYVEREGSVPKSLTLYDIARDNKSGINLNSALGYYFSLVESKSGDSFYISVKNGAIKNSYIVDEALYNRCRNEGSNIMDFDDELEYTIDMDGFTFLANVSLGVRSYIGRYKGSIVFSGSGIVLKSQQFSPYLPADYDEYEERPVLVPSDEIWKNPVEIMGMLYKLYDNVPLSDLKEEGFSDDDNGHRSYTDEEGKVISKFGIDVSSYQGEVNWSKVAEAGAEFAIIRAGYRGYSKGIILEDENFESYVKGAKAAGLKVGVYFYTQAITEAEAIEEADYVIKRMKELGVTGPVVLDSEHVDADENARGNLLKREERTKLARVFFDRIIEEGYKPMLYCGTYWMLFNLDLDRLADVPIWYANYSDTPTTPYKFAIWQYSNEGSLPGIGSAAVDFDIMVEDVFE